LVYALAANYTRVYTFYVECVIHQGNENGRYTCAGNNKGNVIVLLKKFRSKYVVQESRHSTFVQSKKSKKIVQPFTKQLHLH